MSVTYLDQLGGRRYRHRVEEFESLIERLLKDPYSAAGSERLRHQFAGLRSAGRRDSPTRLIFKICVECRKPGDERRVPLDCCADGRTPGRTVNLLCLSEHYADMSLEFEFDE